MLGRSSAGGVAAAVGTPVGGAAVADAAVAPSPISDFWMYAAKLGSVPNSSAGNANRPSRWRSNSLNSLAAPAMELLTVVLAMALARSMVMATATVTTRAISSAVRPKSFQTSGNFALSTTGAFRGIGISPLIVRAGSVIVSAVTQYSLELGALYGLPALSI